MALLKDSIHLEHLSRESFIQLLRHMVEQLKPGRVYYSAKTPAAPDKNASVAPFNRLDITLSGEKHMAFSSGGQIQDVVMRPGDVHFSPPSSWKLPLWDLCHEMSSIIYSSSFIRITYINFDDASEGYDLRGADIFYHTAMPPNETIRAILTSLEIIAAQNGNPTVDSDLVRVLLKLTLKELEQDSGRIYSKAQITWQRIQLYLQENFYAPINRAHVAKVFNLNPSYVSRLFSEMGQEGFVETIRRLRMEHAIELLRTTDLSIDEITAQCGYLSSTFFIAAFKKHFGQPPGKFRRQRLSRNPMRPGATSK